MRELIDGLESIVDQIDQLVRSVTGPVGAKAGAASAEMSAGLNTARERLQEVERDLQDTLKRTAGRTTRQVQDYPWLAIGIAAAAGVVVGVLLATRRESDLQDAQPGRAAKE